MSSLKPDLVVLSIAATDGETFALSAVRRDETGIAAFSRLIETTNPVPPGVLGAQGIPVAAMQEAKAIGAALQDLLAFLPAKGIFLSHDADNVRAWVRKALPGVFEHTILSTHELAGILFPSVGSHELRDLADSLGLQMTADATVPDFRLGQDTLFTLSLWDRLAEEAESLPPALVRELYSQFAPLRTHP